MKKKTIKLVQDLIDKHYLTDWEFVVEVIAPEVEEEEFDVEAICDMVGNAKHVRELENNKHPIN